MLSEVGFTGTQSHVRLRAHFLVNKNVVGLIGNLSGLKVVSKQLKRQTLRIRPLKKCYVSMTDGLGQEKHKILRITHRI